MAIKAILFDLDGTLCDTLTDLAAATNAVLTRHGFAERPVENFRRYVGNGARKQLERAIGQPVEQSFFQQLYEEYLAYYGSHYLVHTRPYDGIPAVLKALHEQGIVMAVVTNKPQQMATHIVRELFGDLFAGVWGNHPDFPLKPDPAMTLQVMEQLHVQPAQVLFVGDSGVDMQTAKNSAATGVGVTWGFRGREELESAGADFVVDLPEEILTIVSQCRS